jgi:glutathione S-transferase
MQVVLYWQSISHPSQAARKMLDLKGVDYKLVDVLPLNQRVHLRLAGFRGGTVPALKLDGQKIQGSRQIARALDARWPEPPLFPSEPGLRARVEEAERWGDQELQPIPRRLFRFAVANNQQLRRWAARSQRFPAPDLVAIAMKPLVAYYASTVESDGRRGSEDVIRADLGRLPGMLERVDGLLADGTLALEPPSAATLQLLATVRLLDAFTDLRPMVREHACAEPANRLFPDYKVELPSFMDADWLGQPAGVSTGSSSESSPGKREGGIQVTERDSKSIADSERSPASEAADEVEIGPDATNPEDEQRPEPPGTAESAGSKTGPDDQPSVSPARGTRH